jgi:hypothetical protein
MENPQYVLQESSFSPFRGSNWISLLKFAGLAVVVGIVISLIMFVIALVFAPFMVADALSGGGGSGGWMLLMTALMITASVVANIFFITAFERWDGCYKKLDE